MTSMMSSARLHLVCLAVCVLLGGYDASSPFSLAIDTDIVIAVADPKTTMYHNSGGIVLSPGLVHFLTTFVSQNDYSKVRMSIVAFSNTVRVLAPFTSNPNDLHLAIQTWRPEFKGARSFLALRSIRSYFKTDARPNAARVVIVVTPQQSENYFATVSESLLLRADNVAIVGVGYSHYVPSQELLAMTGSRHQVLITSNPYYLVYYVNPVKQLICTLSQAFQDALTTVAITTSSATTSTTAAMTSTTQTATTPTTTTTAAATVVLDELATPVMATMDDEATTTAAATTDFESTATSAMTTTDDDLTTAAATTDFESTATSAMTTMDDDPMTAAATVLEELATPVMATMDDEETTTAAATTDFESTATPAMTTMDDDPTTTAIATTVLEELATPVMATTDDEATTSAATTDFESTATSAMTTMDEDPTTTSAATTGFESTATPAMTTMDDEATTMDI